MTEQAPPPESPIEQVQGPIPAWLGTAQHFRWLRGLLVATLALNGADAVFTLFWVHSGYAQEGNPLMEILVLDSPVLFVLAKVALVSLSAIILWRYRNRPTAVVALFMAFGVYYSLALVHATGLGYLLSSKGGQARAARSDGGAAGSRP